MNNIEEKVYWKMIRPTMTYGVECWSIKKQHMQKMSIVEMRILRWMCGKIMKDKIRIECFQDHLAVALVDDKKEKSI